MPADVHALSGAYAADAVGSAERAEFEIHLARCATCRQEVASLREAAARLSSSVAATPPARLRPAVLRAAASLPRTRRVISLPDLAIRGRVRGVPGLLAAAAVVAIAGAAYTVVNLPDGPGTVSAEAVFESPDARVRTIVAGDGTFRVATSRDLDLMAVRAPTPEPSGRRTYQLWVITDRARSLGLLDEPRVFAPIPDSGRLAVTVEPLAGSPEPTTVPLFAVDVTQL